MPELTALQKDERDALLGDKEAALRVVSALRRYREEVALSLSRRYRDGAIDGVETSRLAFAVEDIEEDEGSDEDAYSYG